MARRTLANDVTLTGVALHSGVTGSVTCRPSSAAQGITFFQRDTTYAARSGKHRRSKFATASDAGRVTM